MALGLEVGQDGGEEIGLDGGVMVIGDEQGVAVLAALARAGPELLLQARRLGDVAFAVDAEDLLLFGVFLARPGCGS